MAKLKISAILESYLDLAPTVRHFVFKVEQPFDFIPGQFITLHFQYQNEEIARSYSIANTPNPDNLLEISLSNIKGGVASQYLSALNIGDKILISGPAGKLVLPQQHPKRYILIATGTGIAPYRSMLNQLADIITNTETTVIILFGVRTRAECIYQKEFCQFAKQHAPKFTFKVFYSRDTHENLLTNHEYSGHVQNIFPELQLVDGDDMIFLCGNPNMIDDSYQQLTDLGFKPANVRREKYLWSKRKK